MPAFTSLALHLVPGALTTVAWILLAPVMIAHGFPALFGLLFATLFVLVPLELAWLAREARRAGKKSLLAVVDYREPLAARQYILWTVALFVWGIVSSMLAAPIDNASKQHLFAWLPEWYSVSSAEQFFAYSKPVMWATFLLGLVVGGIVGPITEELYFRGYLLPRMSRLGRWAPFVHVLLFSFYHFWTPWQNMGRILLMVPLTYLVWWKRNIYVGMLAHMTLNTIVWIVTIGSILKAHP
jgi:membrane protease YdiL (CAAX protease family)